MNRLAQWLAVMALVATLGGHWAFLQGVAWASMLARFSQSMPFSEAVAFTFDGKHPCKMCLAVQKGQQEESKESKLKPVQKLVLILNAQVLVLLPPAPALPPAIVSEVCESRTDEPPRHPPRMNVGALASSARSECRSSGAELHVTGSSLVSVRSQRVRLGSARDAQSHRVRGWELPRWAVPTYPDCENHPLHGKSSA